MSFIFCLTVLFSLVVSWALLVPIVTGKKDILDKNNSEDIEWKKEKLLSRLEDLEYDYRSKKILKEQYLSLKEELINEISELRNSSNSDEESKKHVFSRAA